MERRVSALFAELGIGDLTPTQANVLVVLFHRKRPIHGRELAATLGVSEVTVARFLKALEQSEWVARTPHPEDARARLIALTPKAYRALPTLIRVSNTMMDEAFEGVDSQAIEAFAHFTSGVLANMEKTQ